EGFDIGGVREPLTNLTKEDKEIAKEAAKMVKDAIAKFC
ncbi:MAG TPA: N-acetylneuraminate lyase, partial [Lachnospiraceae bacterium]|nr:N-acetylneuraminate lyase [Lachnospiraceae bacterium]